MTLISIIIPSWNQRALLGECITSIVNTKCSLPNEIIVVDDASSDDTVEYLRNNFPEVILIKNSTNEGYAKAVNKGASLAKGDFLFLLNNDVVLTEGAIERLVSFLSGHPDAGAVAPLLVYPDGRLQISCRRFPAPAALMLEKLRINKVWRMKRWKLTHEEHLRGGSVPQPMASALMIRRKCWDAVGPMDERFPIFFNDVDWCFRVYKDTPYIIALDTGIKVIHHLGATVNMLGWKKKKEFYKGLVRFYLKHFPFKAEIKK